MSDKTPDRDSADDIDAQYRRAAAVNPGRPADSVRQAILDHAAKLAAQRAGDLRAIDRQLQRPAANESRWRPAIVGSLAAAALAGLLITPHFLPSGTPLVAPLAMTRPEAPSAKVAAPTAAVATVTQKPMSSQTAQPAQPDRAADSTRAEFSGRAQTAMRLQSQASAGAYAAGPAAEPAPATTAMARAPAAMARAAAPVGDYGAALRLAAASGNVTELRALLASGADVNTHDDLGRTALMLATLGGRQAAVETLLAHGADPNAADANGVTPWQAAVAANQPAIAAALQRAGAR